MQSLPVSMTRDDLDGRMNCFGEFERADSVCLKACALNINCAIAKNKFLGFQLMEGTTLGFNHFDIYEELE